MGGTGSKRAYPEWPKRQLTDEWRQLVIDTLAANKAAKPRIEPYDNVTLARMIGVDKSAIGRMLLMSTHPKAQDTSSLVDPICDLLKIPPPTQAVSTEDDELIKSIKALDVRERALVADLVRTLEDRGVKKRNRSGS